MTPARRTTLFAQPGVTGKVFDELCEYSVYIRDSVVPELIDEWVTFVEKSTYTFAARGQAPNYRVNMSVRVYYDGVKIGNLTGMAPSTEPPV